MEDRTGENTHESLDSELTKAGHSGAPEPLYREECQLWDPHWPGPHRLYDQGRHQRTWEEKVHIKPYKEYLRQEPQCPHTETVLDTPHLSRQTQQQSTQLTDNQLITSLTNHSTIHCPNLGSAAPRATDVRSELKYFKHRMYLLSSSCPITGI